MKAKDRNDDCKACHGTGFIFIGRDILRDDEGYNFVREHRPCHCLFIGDGGGLAQLAAAPAG
jgi:hypothetical protein